MSEAVSVCAISAIFVTVIWTNYRLRLEELRQEAKDREAS